jgi:hypothetical protein
MLYTVKNWPFQNFKSLLAFSLLVATVSLTSCFNDDEVTPLPPAAYVLVYQGSPDAPEMDIYADQNKVNTFPIKYTEGVTYSPFYTGNRTFEFQSYTSQNLILEKNFILKADSVYSIFVLGEVAQIDAILIKDEWEEPIAEEAQLRLVNLSPDTGNVILEISGQETAFINDLEFGAASEFDEIQNGTFDFTIKSKNSGEVLVTATDIELKGNRVYTLILRGLESSTENDTKLDLQLITNYTNY